VNSALRHAPEKLVNAVRLPNHLAVLSDDLYLFAA